MNYGFALSQLGTGSIRLNHIRQNARWLLGLFESNVTQEELSAVFAANAEDSDDGVVTIDHRNAEKSGWTLTLTRAGEAVVMEYRYYGSLPKKGDSFFSLAYESELRYSSKRHSEIPKMFAKEIDGAMPRLLELMDKRFGVLKREKLGYLIDIAHEPCDR